MLGYLDIQACHCIVYWKWSCDFPDVYSKGGSRGHAPPSQGCCQGIFFTKALAEFQHVNCKIVRIWESRELHAMLGLKLFTEAVASMVATPLQVGTVVLIILLIEILGKLQN